MVVEVEVVLEVKVEGRDVYDILPSCITHEYPVQSLEFACVK